MGSKHYRPTPEHLQFFQQNSKMTQQELKEAINKKFNLELTDWKVWHILQKLGLSKGSKIFSEENLQFLRENYPLMSRTELTAVFNEKFNLNMTKDQIIAAVKNHKIRSGRNGLFTKGNPSWNKGRKGLTKPNSGQFLRGCLPQNLKPLWSERVDDYGFILIKVPEPNPYTKAKTRYLHKHIYVWEQANGPVPEGYAVIFRDSKKENCALENLELVTKAELLRLNQLRYREVPEEYKQVALTVAKLDVRTFQLRKKLKERQHGE